MISKRDLLKSAFAVSALGLPAGWSIGQSANAKGQTVLPMISHAIPITDDERRARIARVQKLMRDRKIGGLLLEPGASMEYFSGLKWWRSERLTAVVIPAEGDIAVVTPYFEERTIEEGMTLSTEVRTWHEHENPFDRVASVLTDRGVKGPLAMEDSVRFFVVDGLRKSSNRGVVSGAAVVNGCRMLKSPAEIALMQLANDITMVAYKRTYGAIEKGMTPADIRRLMNDATTAEGATPTFSIALVDEASSFPHGSDQPQVVRDGSLILMDCGCDVYGYKSDISRTFVMGQPSAKHRRVWDVVKRGQELALETAKVGVPAGRVDDVVRAYYAKEGFGPDYQTPGLSHRLGHGIGMEGHEPINFVRGEDTPLAAGMCLSNEPGIYIPGEFGVRLEDCLYMTENGPQLFTPLSDSIANPMNS